MINKNLLKRQETGDPVGEEVLSTHAQHTHTYLFLKNLHFFGEKTKYRENRIL